MGLPPESYKSRFLERAFCRNLSKSQNTHFDTQAARCESGETPAYRLCSPPGAPSATRTVTISCTCTFCCGREGLLRSPATRSLRICRARAWHLAEHLPLLQLQHLQHHSLATRETRHVVRLLKLLFDWRGLRSPFRDISGLPPPCCAPPFLSSKLHSRDLFDSWYQLFSQVPVILTAVRITGTNLANAPSATYPVNKNRYFGRGGWAYSLPVTVG